ncbi:MAG: polysaccharide biosynthesis protein [Actinomycetota bacterium]|nr:polysaccharide biosynthesis protein [Actinomycetota bacterium]
MGKRAFDVLVSAVVMVVASPLWLVVALLIKVESPGPVFHRATRIGRGGVPFTLYKFRTMVADARSRGPGITGRDDPRITGLGRILRWAKIDEMPQLINVLKGDMSIVGPRPEDPRYVEQYTEDQRRVLAVRPGMASPAFIAYRHEEEMLAGEPDPEERYANDILPAKLAMDLDYVDRHSFLFDLSVLGRAALSLVKPAGSAPLPRTDPGASSAAPHVSAALLPKGLIRHRRPVIVLAHAVLLATAYYLAWVLHFDFRIPPAKWEVFVKSLAVLLVIKMVVFWPFQLYEGLWRYISMRDILSILFGASVASVVFGVAIDIRAKGLPVPILILDWVFTLALVGGVRLLVRAVREGSLQTRVRAKRAVVVGAGDGADRLIREVRRNPDLDYRLVGLIDDDRRKMGRRIHGVPVIGTVSDIPRISKAMSVDEILIAIPSVSDPERVRIIESAREAAVPLRSVPPLRDLFTGRATIGQLRDVRPQDVLGRQEVWLDVERLRREVTGRRILITGAGGSIGSELARQLATLEPASLVLYERAENSLFFVDHELRRRHPDVDLVPVVGDIRDRPHLSEVFGRHRPELVYHAAAYKQVPLMEQFPLEAIENNVFGTRSIACAAREHGANKFVLISSDKAVRPVGVMGMTKRVAETLVKTMDGEGCRFVSVRFGNVLGSDGSVLPLFERQIAAGGPVTVTDPHASRFLMLLSEAVQLVLEAGSIGEGGEVFFLDPGEPVRIMDLATSVIRLHGLEPGRDVKVEVTGLRPGERLREEFVGDTEELRPTGHEKIFKVQGNGLNADVFRKEMDELQARVASRDQAGALRCLRDMAALY